MKEIYKRRSIRTYKEDKIPVETLELLVKAGMNAPSAHNKRPYQFVVVTDKTVLEQLSIASPYSSMLKGSAAAIILVAAQTTPYWQQDMGASCQNILLEATSMELGSCWIGCFPNIEACTSVRHTLNIPSELEVFAIISLGYCKQGVDENAFYEQSRIHYETW